MVSPVAAKLAFHRYPELLTAAAARDLHNTQFLEAKGGALSAPANTYIENPTTKAILPDDTSFVVGWRRPLLVRLGCISSPTSDDIIQALRRHRDDGTSPAP